MYLFDLSVLEKIRDVTRQFKSRFEFNSILSLLDTKYSSSDTLKDNILLCEKKECDLLQFS
jgi:hypothetical protein